MSFSDAWWLPEASARGSGMKLQQLVAKQLAPQVCFFKLSERPPYYCFHRLHIDIDMILLWTQVGPPKARDVQQDAVYEAELQADHATNFLWPSSAQPHVRRRQRCIVRVAAGASTTSLRLAVGCGDLLRSGETPSQGSCLSMELVQTVQAGNHS